MSGRDDDQCEVLPKSQLAPPNLTIVPTPILVNVSANLVIVQQCAKEIHSLHKCFRYDWKDVKVTRIFCALCANH